MSIESVSIIYFGFGFLFAVLIYMAVQTIVEEIANQLVGKKKDAIHPLRAEIDNLKIELNVLKSKLEVTTYESKMTAGPNFLPISPTTSQLVLEDAWLRGNGQGQFAQEDRWSRDVFVSDPSIIPTISQSTASETRTRDMDEREPVNEYYSLSYGRFRHRALRKSAR
jgi:hypothetical protein